MNKVSISDPEFQELHKKIKARVLSHITSIIDVSNALEDAQKIAQSKGWKNTSLNFTTVQAMIKLLIDAVYEINQHVHDLDQAMLMANKIARATTNALDRSMDLRSAINDYAHGKISKENLDTHFQNFLDA